MMRFWMILSAVCFSANAMAQQASPPKVGNKPLVQVRPKAPTGCKLVGTVKGTKLWAGDCTASEPNNAAIDPPAPAPLAAQAAGAITSDPKE
jgi:hypothetical protein